jgi:hypothetical protein
VEWKVEEHPMIDGVMLFKWIYFIYFITTHK